jgi:hypothetical protein
MSGAQSDRENSPQIVLTQVSAKRKGVKECWSIDWLVENQGTDPLKILAARLPHGQFKSEEYGFEPALDLAPGESNQFKVSVGCNEPAGLVTENAFVIFKAIWLSEPWRIFVRLRVMVTADGRPETATELITTQRVGFSGVDS